MKVKIHPVDIIELDIPDYIFRGYNEDHMLGMLEAYIRDSMIDPGWYTVNANDKNEVRLAYKRRKKGLDRLDAETERGNVLRTST